jgi:two-component system sensor histidine kinase DegS
MMNDENKIENNEEKISNEKQSYGSFLRDIALEYEEKLYSIKIQIKKQMNILKQKENEREEIERTRVHNLDLFSPIYNKAQNGADSFTDIDKIKNKINELENEQTSITNKIKSIKESAEFIDKYESNKSANLVEDITDNQEEKYGYHVKGLSILEAQEIERQRIARDLHDSTVQNLTSLVHKSELCIKLIDIDSIRAKLELSSMSHTIKSVINDMRGIIYNLKPMTLDDLGLTVTIERYANRIMDLNNIKVIMHSNDETKEILPVVKLTLFRIIQEACNNIIKHANATIISININYEDNKVTVTIKDNGSGFNIIPKENNENSGHSSSFGLSIMRERISLLSGTVDIKSEKGIGTIVTVSAPLTYYEEEENE